MSSQDRPCRGGGSQELCGIYDCHISYCLTCGKLIIRGFSDDKEKVDFERHEINKANKGKLRKLFILD